MDALHEQLATEKLAELEGLNFPVERVWYDENPMGYILHVSFTRPLEGDEVQEFQNWYDVAKQD